MLRRAIGSKVWHFCENCPHWPTEDYRERGQPVAPVCSTCMRMYAAGTCDYWDLPFLAHDHVIIEAWDRLKLGRK